MFNDFQSQTLCFLVNSSCCPPHGSGIPNAKMNFVDNFNEMRRLIDNCDLFKSAYGFVLFERESKWFLTDC